MSKQVTKAIGKQPINIKTILTNTSFDKVHDTVSHALGNFVSGCAIKRILFVPFASKNWDIEIAKAKSYFNEVHSLQLISLRNSSDLLETSNTTDAICIGPGNIYRLIYYLQETKLWPIIREKILSGMPYIGSNAGAHLLMNSFSLSTDMPLFDINSKVAAFNILPFVVLLIEEQDIGGDDNYLKSRITEYFDCHSISILTLKTQSALFTDGKNIRFLVGSGELFEKRGENINRLSIGSDSTVNINDTNSFTIHSQDTTDTNTINTLNAPASRFFVIVRRTLSDEALVQIEKHCHMRLVIIDSASKFFNQHNDTTNYLPMVCDMEINETIYNRISSTITMLQEKQNGIVMGICTFDKDYLPVVAEIAQNINLPITAPNIGETVNMQKSPQSLDKYYKCVSIMKNGIIHFVRIVQIETKLDENALPGLLHQSIVLPCSLSSEQQQNMINVSKITLENLKFRNGVLSVTFNMLSDQSIPVVVEPFLNDMNIYYAFQQVYKINLLAAHCEVMSNDINFSQIYRDDPSTFLVIYAWYSPSNQYLARTDFLEKIKNKSPRILDTSVFVSSNCSLQNLDDHVSNLAYMPIARIAVTGSTSPKESLIYANTLCSTINIPMNSCAFNDILVYLNGTLPLQCTTKIISTARLMGIRLACLCNMDDSIEANDPSFDLILRMDTTINRNLPDRIVKRLKMESQNNLTTFSGICTFDPAYLFYVAMAAERLQLTTNPADIYRDITISEPTTSVQEFTINCQSDLDNTIKTIGADNFPIVFQEVNGTAKNSPCQVFTHSEEVLQYYDKWIIQPQKGSPKKSATIKSLVAAKQVIVHTVLMNSIIQCSVVSDYIQLSDSMLSDVTKFCLVSPSTLNNNLLQRIQTICHKEIRDHGFVGGIIHTRVFMNETTEEIELINVAWHDPKIVDMFYFSDIAIHVWNIDFIGVQFEFAIGKTALTWTSSLSQENDVSLYIGTTQSGYLVNNNFLTQCSNQLDKTANIVTANIDVGSSIPKHGLLAHVSARSQNNEIDLIKSVLQYALQIDSLPISKFPITFGRQVASFSDIYCKQLFVVNAPEFLGQRTSIKGWLHYPRDVGHVLFFNLIDSSGSIQVVVPHDRSCYQLIKSLMPESAIEVHGVVQQTPRQLEIMLDSITVINPASRRIDPPLRGQWNLFDQKHLEHVLRYRHLYQRHPYRIAIDKFRDVLLQQIRNWFSAYGFIDFSAPILTACLLYEPDTAIEVKREANMPIYMSQCAGFYLESASHALERVYNLGPSFRNESRSRRHLLEYWHVKAEIAFATMEDMIETVEVFLRDIIEACNSEGVRVCSILKTGYQEAVKPPFPRITYSDAVNLIHEKGFQFQSGKHFNTEHETILTKCVGHGQPIWITYPPVECEPFPYSLDDIDHKRVKVADLIVPDSYGELCGIAEKIMDKTMLEQRLNEKNKSNCQQYEWVRDTRELGCVPHGGFGMGFERLIRWLLRLHHVRECLPFPREYGRKIWP